MKHLEVDLEAKRCILPVFARRFLQLPAYSSLALAFKHARRFLVRSDPTSLHIFRRLREWFQLPDEERASLCHAWMVSIE